MKTLIYVLRERLFYYFLAGFTFFNLLFMLDIFQVVNLSVLISKQLGLYETLVVFNFIISLTLLFYFNRIKPLAMEIFMSVLYVLIIFTYISLFLFTDFGLALNSL